VTIERQDSVATAVEIEQLILFGDGESARVGNARVAAEGAERLARAIESKEHSVPVTIDSPCACDEEWHEMEPSSGRRRRQVSI
jgi:hypothetical protein